MPLYGAETISLSPSQIGLVFSLLTLANLLVVIPAGALGDRFGRKRAILPSAAVAALGLVLYAFSGNFWGFLAASLVAGIGSGIAGPAPVAWAADVAPLGRQGVAVGLFRSFGDLGFLLGPVLLGMLADAGGFGVALSANAALLVGIALLLGLWGRETAGRQGRKGRASVALGESRHAG